ncbi:AAA family ATPase [Burkholderia gladioli]|uniref:AAA+ ATPase domain-containing protein n=1 Tax=Burkholderia gladioli (strain BSR3) TaxID=999541 RepID=F2L9I4_BURGS|nr:ATP-binding protein [Burkholderia gladioli]AEA59747.1 hypothetical protein bgla_1g10640 [Burkholderia gladioli BSR3]
MRIEYRNDYLSIKKFNPVDVPDFIVLTGINGSGKSHLLKAIEGGQVLVDGVTGGGTLFSAETFKLNDDTGVQTHSIRQAKEQAWRTFDSGVRARLRQSADAIADQLPDLVRQAAELNVPLLQLPGGGVFGQYKLEIRGFLSPISSGARMHDQAQIYPSLLNMLMRLPYPGHDLTRDEFDKYFRVSDGERALLPLHLGRVIWSYYVEMQANRNRRYTNLEYGSGLASYSDEEFFEYYGDKPWDVLNSILEEFGSLDYRIPSPEGMDSFLDYRLKIQSKSNPELSLDFSNLSSGERVMFALVGAMYRAGTVERFPQVVLLDEIDASLHPSMIRIMLSIIENILVKKGIKVILVTHSATTVALSPDGSIYIMNRRGEDRIRPSVKNEALEILSEGFVTLEKGLLLMEELDKTGTCIITEGYNTVFLRRALDLYGVEGVTVISGLESRTGNRQLRTLFDFFARVPHKNKVIIIWDCDVAIDVESVNNTYALQIDKNPKNKVARKGIENAFHEDLLMPFCDSYPSADGSERFSFKSNCKRDFERMILGRNDVGDFSHFEGLCKKIKEINCS